MTIEAAPTDTERSAASCGRMLSAERTMAWLAKLASARKATARIGDGLSISFLANCTAPALPLPACGERVGVRGHIQKLRSADTPPGPASFARRPLPARRGEVTLRQDACGRRNL